MTDRAVEGRERRCDWSDLPESMCAHCRGNLGEDLPSPSDKPPRHDYHPKPIPAVFRGTCPDCGEPIEPGELIVGMEVGPKTSWSHWHCIDD